MYPSRRATPMHASQYRERPAADLRSSCLSGRRRRPNGIASVDATRPKRSIRGMAELEFRTVETDGKLRKLVCVDTFIRIRRFDLHLVSSENAQIVQ
jgi:hypothetical protein